MFHGCEHGSYLQVPRLRPLRNNKVMEQAIRFRRKGLLFNYMLARVCYDALGDVNSRFVGGKNEKSNVPRLPHDERVFRADSSTSGFKALNCVQQTNMLWMEDTIHSFALLGGLVVDCCADTLSVVKACVLFLLPGASIGVIWI